MNFDSTRALIVSAALAASAATLPGRTVAQTRPAPQPQAVPSATAAEPPLPPGTIQFGAMERAPEAYGKDTAPKTEKKSLFNKAKSVAKKAEEATSHELAQDLGNERYAELFIKISDSNGPLYIHAFPVDPVTGERREYHNLDKARLRVFVLNEQQHNQVVAEQKDEYQKYQAEQLPKFRKVMEALPIKAPENFPTDAMARAKMLDVAEAINDADLAYRPDPLDRKQPTIDGNAAIAAMLGKVAPPELCGTDTCSMITDTYSSNASFKFIGIENSHITETLTTGKTYQDAVAKIVQDNATAKTNADKANAAAAATSKPALKTPSAKTRAHAGTKPAPDALTPTAPVKPVVAVQVSPEEAITTTFKTKWPFKDESVAPVTPQQNPAPKQGHIFGP